MNKKLGICLIGLFNSYIQFNVKKRVNTNTTVITVYLSDITHGELLKLIDLGFRKDNNTMINIFQEENNNE